MTSPRTPPLADGFLFARPLAVPDAEAVIFGRTPTAVGRG